MPPSAPVLPPHEPQRLRAVRRYEILDTPPDGAFDRVARLAAHVFDTPIATVTIVDEDRIWFKATHGIEVIEIGRDPGLCASAICQEAPYLVEDALTDPRTLNNPLVRGELGLRFYAAAPIRVSGGYNLGTVNVIDRLPRRVEPARMGVLEELAGIVADELELRLTARHTVESERAQKRRAEFLTGILQQRLLPQRSPRVPRLEVATHYQPATKDFDAGGDFFDVFEIEPGLWALDIGDVCGKGPQAAAVTGEIRHMLRALARVERRPGQVLARLNEVLYREGGEDPLDEGFAERFCTVAFLLVDTRGPQIEIVASSAGHPLPLVRRGDGAVETLGKPGQLLGPFPEVSLSEASVTLGVGDMLLLYTDGAVEQRSTSLTVGERALVKGLETAGHPDALSALDHLRRAVEDQQDGAEDDTALVLLRVAT